MAAEGAAGLVATPGVPLCVFARRLVTCDEARASASSPLGVLEDAALVVGEGRVVELGARAEVEGTLRSRYPAAQRLDATDVVVTPGLCDAHTHAAWMGSRGREYALRMAGAGYEAIAAAGGGIAATMRAVREASREQIAASLRARLRRMASLGVTAVEVKSGYGLDPPSERKLLEAIADVAGASELPAVVPTYLGLHAVPPEARADRPAYVRAATEALDGLAADGLCRYVDAYIDRNAFTTAEAEPLFRRARALGLGVRAHVGQFADVGGAELAAAVGAASVDHVEQLGERGTAALGAAGVRAVLLPVASFTLAQSPPPVALLRAAGVPLVVASDANPGTAPTESLPLALALAVRSYGLSVAEALGGVTREAARSLGLPGGVLAPGTPADFVVWDLPHEDDLVAPWGLARVRLVVRAGRVLHAAPAS
ncbi:MAG: imidazolonepropionase [Myxococcales bacterium]|nr:imidazolonepropionase [Myxococcales bacterium]